MSGTVVHDVLHTPCSIRAGWHDLLNETHSIYVLDIHIYMYGYMVHIVPRGGFRATRGGMAKKVFVFIESYLKLT